MGTVEPRSKAPSGCSSPSPENDKNELREALCALKNGVPENGVGFSSQVYGGCGVVEWADSEMNGVSSLLKMRGSGGSSKLNSGDGSFGVGMEGKSKDWRKSEDENDRYGKVVTMDVPIADTRENKDLEMDDLGDQGYGFSIGDFVWGKIKSHPWWPGRIFDPSDASDFALKLRQKSRLLVAYFGDGTFAWCHPSQLKRFEENFDNMIVQSSSKAFVNAAQEAVNEVGRLLHLKMSNSCAVKKTRTEFTPPLANNYGIKEGVLIPENGIERLSDVLIDPAELSSRVKQIAEVIAVSSILELEILKARLSAFYLWRGGYKLPNYEVPRPIPGLEDSFMDEAVHVGRSEGAVEAPTQGPFEEDCSTLLLSSKSGEFSFSHWISGNRSNHRIKQKSIAEILRENNDVNTKDKIKEGDATEKLIFRKKREGREDAMASKPVQKRKGVLTSTDRNMASDDNDGSGRKWNSDNRTLLQLKEKKGVLRFGNENASSGSKMKTDVEGRAREQNEKVSSPRERKRSKYLSPPFTIPTREQRKVDIETESLSIKAQPSEPVARASDQLLKSPVPSKCNRKVLQDNFSTELSIERDHLDISNYQTPEDDENRTFGTMKFQPSLGEVLSEVRDVAISPKIPRDINYLEKFVDVIFIFRNSIYHQGSYHKIYKKHQPSKKRKMPESGLGMLRKVSVATNDSETKKSRKKNLTTLGMPQEKQAAVADTGKKGSDENAASAAALLVSFGPGSSLPLKSDLITLYSKFGAINELETAVFSSNYTAQVLFLKASDAEKALSHSQNTSPFGSSEVSFRLQYLSAVSKSREHGKKSKSKASLAKKDNTPANPSASLSPGSETSKLNYIKQKLQGLTSMLEASDGKSPDMKIKMESEMKGLLEDVNKMVEASLS